MLLKRIIVFIAISFIFSLILCPVMAESAKDWKVKGDEYKNNKQWDKALECYEKSVKIDSNFGRSVLNIGYVYTEKGNLSKGLEYVNNAIKLSESGKDTSGLLLEDAYIEKAYILMELDKNKESLACYDKAIELNPKWPDAWLYKAGALMYLGKYKDAVPCLDKVLEIDPKNQEAKDMKAQCQKKLN